MNQFAPLQTLPWKVLSQRPLLKAVSQEAGAESTCPLLRPGRRRPCSQMDRWTHKKGSLGLYQQLANEKSCTRFWGDMKRPLPLDFQISWCPWWQRRRNPLEFPAPTRLPPPTSFPLSSTKKKKYPARQELSLESILWYLLVTSNILIWAYVNIQRDLALKKSSSVKWN